MDDESRHARRRAGRPSSRWAIGLGFGLVITVLAVGALVPAFADDSSNSATQDATATTAAPQATTATTATAGTTPSSPTLKQDPPSTTQPSKNQAASVQQESTANVGTQSVALVPCQNSGTNPNSFQSDSRASPNGECFAGNFTSDDCTTGSSFQSQDNPTGTDANSDVSGTVTNSGTTLNITILNPNVVIGKIIVKGGNGYNVYTSPVSNMISPLNGGGNIPAISHWVVCYDVTTPQPGSLTVTKSVVGTPPGGATFTVAVDCNDGSSHDRTLTFDSTGALTGGGPLPITGIPAGTQCSVTETGTGSASNVTYSPGGANPPTVTIASNQQSSVTVTNAYTGSLTVAKSVVGTPPGGATFTVAVDCNDGSGHDRTLTFDSSGQLTGGGPLPITGIPAGTQCSVTETGTGGANTVTYSPGGANPPTVTIQANQQSSVTVTNTYSAGSLTVMKSVVGTPPGGATFTVAVDCNDGSGHDRTLTFDSSGALTDGGPLPITGIPTGTQCTVTETGTGSASSVTYSPGGANPPTVTIQANQQSSVTVTNTYNKPETGALQVRKTTEGDVPPGVSWKVTVTCTNPNFSTTLDFAPNDLGPKTVTGIPLNNGSNSCSVAETDKGTPPPTLVTVTPNSAQNVTSDTTPLFTVLNSYPQGELFGSVSVTKAVTGDGKPDAGAQFTVHVSCTDGTEADLVFGTTGGTKQVTGIKIDEDNGTNCTVTEPETGHASHVSFSPDDNGKFTLTVNSPDHAITVTNRFDAVEVGGIGVTGGVGAVTGTVAGVAAGTLPFTGSSTALLLKIAAWLLGIGGLALLIARKLRRASPR